MKLDVLLKERDVLWNFDTWMSSTPQNSLQHCSHICSRKCSCEVFKQWSVICVLVLVYS